MMGDYIMESLELKIFKEVAYTHSITQAAENMGYVQSNVTAHIKKLENELKTTLFIRNSKGVLLTRDGERLLHQAEKIIELLDITAQSFINKAETLNIGTTQTIAGYLLPQCLLEYKKSFQNILISVHTLNPDKFDIQLANGQLDCIITNHSHAIPHGKQIFQCQEKLLLIAPQSCIAIEQIIGLPIIVNHIESCPYRKILLNWYTSQYPLLPEMIELDTVESILNMVVRGGGITLLPKSILSHTKDINTFDIEDLQASYIHMWIAKNKLISEYSMLKNIIENYLKYDI